jgi:hypothetical protein
MTPFLSLPHSLPCGTSAGKAGLSLRPQRCTPEAKRRNCWNTLKTITFYKFLAAAGSAAFVYFLPKPVRIALYEERKNRDKEL